MSNTPPPSNDGPWGWDAPNGQQGHWPTPPVPQQPPPGPPSAPAQQGVAQSHLPPSPPPPKRSRAGLFALVAVLVLILGVGVGWGLTHFLSSDDGSVVTQPSEAPSSKTSDSSAPDPSASGSANDDANTAGPGSSAGADELPDDPTEALTQIAETDREEVVADLEGKWVPQISSKRAGMEIDGETWTDEDILADHQALRDEHPRVRLLWSGDFGSFKENDFWVTIAGIGYSDPDQALSWCATNGLGPDDCYAKQLNTGGDDEGTTRLQ